MVGVDIDRLLEAQSKKVGLPGDPMFPRGHVLPLWQFDPWIGTQPSVGGKTREVRTTIEDKLAKLEETIKGLKKELSACRGQIYGLCADLKARPAVKQTQLIDIGEEFELTQSIPIVLEESEDGTIASFPEVELFAIGATESEAILNLKSKIIELFTDLTGTSKNELGKLPRAWLRVLNKVMKPIGKH
jgi:hypothetical protein